MKITSNLPVGGTSTNKATKKVRKAKHTSNSAPHKDIFPIRDITNADLEQLGQSNHIEVERDFLPKSIVAYLLIQNDNAREQIRNMIGVDTYV